MGKTAKLIGRLRKVSKRYGKKMGKAMKWQAIGAGVSNVVQQSSNAYDRYKNEQTAARLAPSLGIDPDLAKGLTRSQLTELALMKQRRDQQMASVQALASRIGANNIDMSKMDPEVAMKMIDFEQRRSLAAQERADRLPLLQAQTESEKAQAQASLSLARQRDMGLTGSGGKPVIEMTVQEGDTFNKRGVAVGTKVPIPTDEALRQYETTDRAMAAANARKIAANEAATLKRELSDLDRKLKAETNSIRREQIQAERDAKQAGYEMKLMEIGSDLTRAEMAATSQYRPPQDSATTLFGDAMTWLKSNVKLPSLSSPTGQKPPPPTPVPAPAAAPKAGAGQSDANELMNPDTGEKTSYDEASNSWIKTDGKSTMRWDKDANSWVPIK